VVGACRRKSLKPTGNKGGGMSGDLGGVFTKERDVGDLCLEKRLNGSEAPRIQTP